MIPRYKGEVVKKCDKLDIYLPLIYFKHVLDINGVAHYVLKTSQIAKRATRQQELIEATGFATIDAAREKYNQDPSFFERDARATVVVNPLASDEEIAKGTHIRAVRCSRLGRFVHPRHIYPTTITHTLVDRNSGLTYKKYKNYSRLKDWLDNTRNTPAATARRKEAEHVLAYQSYKNYHDAYYALVHNNTATQRMYGLTVQDTHTYATWKEYIRATSEDDAINQIYKNLQNVCITECLLLD